MLKLHTETIDPSVLERTEYVLDLIRKGEVSSICIAWVWRDGAASSTFSRLHNAATMLGALDLAQHKIRNAPDEK